MEGSTLKLTVEKGPREGETLDCTTGSVIKIGRVVKGNTFTIKDSGISSKHLVIEFKNGKWVISDLDTSNGTILNDIELQPLTDFDLRDEDVIKIGEFTSLKVRIVEEIKPTKGSKKTSKKESVDVAIAQNFDAEDGDEHQLRRNPRRGAAPRNTRVSKDETSESALVSVSNKVQKTSANLNLGLENCRGTESVASVADNRPRRGRPRKLKDESVAVQKISESSELGPEISREPVNVVPAGEKRTRRGAPKRLRGSKDEQVTTSEVQQISENSNAELVNCTEVSDVAEKTRVSKEDEASQSVSDMQKGLQNLSFDQQECCKEPQNLAPIEKKQTRRRVAERRAKASQDKTSASESVQIPVAPQNNPKQSNLHEGFSKQSNLEQETCRESASTSAAKENLVPENDEKVGNEIDWEKMTLGDWFDYLESNLPKQLHEITDEIISSMRERSKQFTEFMLQQQDGKGKLPMI
ncbi:Forkhead-associated (FHA) domain [Macleaya cordata]|uniref:Forkhead-associated (FHA) domain n=1 Tax=Macleaya cordata TaxID=56857 RepID=A0A200R233_MACCD|nr:Forkhead-associated (FHA) domain [Macleaya cordata]